MIALPRSRLLSPPCNECGSSDFEDLGPMGILCVCCGLEQPSLDAERKDSDPFCVAEEDAGGKGAFDAG